MAGGLFDPLGTDRTPDRPAGRSVARLSPLLAVAVLALAAMAALIVIAYLRDDGDRGQPRVISTIDHVALPPTPPAMAPVPSSQPAPGTSVATDPTATSVTTPLRDDQEVEVQNGVRIIRPRRTPAQGQAAKSATTPAPSNPVVGR